MCLKSSQLIVSLRDKIKSPPSRIKLCASSSVALPVEVGVSDQPLTQSGNKHWEANYLLPTTCAHRRWPKTIRGECGFFVIIAKTFRSVDGHATASWRICSDTSSPNGSAVSWESLRCRVKSAQTWKRRAQDARGVYFDVDCNIRLLMVILAALLLSPGGSGRSSRPAGL